MNCPDKKCPINQFKCQNNNCIPNVWVCDGDNDCGDNTDEMESCTARTCPVDHFKCPGGKCIPDNWRCDGDADCENGEDEDCKTEEKNGGFFNKTCDASYFK